MLNFYYYSIKYLDLLEKHDKLIGFIKSVEKMRNSIIFDPQEILNTRPQSDILISAIRKQQADIQNINDKILQLVRTKRPNEIFQLTNNLITDLNFFDHVYNDNNSLIQALKDIPEKHTDAYSEKEAAQIFTFTELCSKVAQSFSDLMEKSRYIIEEFKKSTKVSPKEYVELNIGTDVDLLRIEDFVIFMEGLADLYMIISIIHQVDHKQYPIIINHISTGSWYGEILGIKHVVESIERLMLSFGGFMRDYITGKISREQFENKCKKSEVYLELIAKANELGLKNSEVGIFKGFNSILDKLVSNATEFEINGNEILGIRKTEKLTLVEKRNDRQVLVEKINLLLEAQSKSPSDKSGKKEDKK